MMGVQSYVVAVAALTASLLGLGHATADPAPSWIVLKISRVQVQPTKIDGSTWDLPSEKKSSNCGPVAMIGKMAFGVPGGVIATVLCSSSAPGQRDRDARAPDLFVQVVAGDAKYRTPIALDTYAEAFDFPVVVPLDGIPPAGLEVQVLDQDDDAGTGELIGMVRVTRARVQEALASSMPLLTLADSQVSRIEIEVAPYSPPAPIEPLMFEVNHEPAALPIRARAGELVMIEAHGKYSVASDLREIDEHGYTDGGKRSYNRTDFKNTNHGAAVALVGASTESHAALAVGSCVTAVASTAGQIFTGVNDSEVGNNQGFIRFAVRVGLPTVEQWRSGGAFACPRQAQRSDHAPVAEAPADADLPNAIDRAIITAAIARVKPDVAACRASSPARGMVKVAVTVGSDGRVADVSIRSAPERRLAMCVATAVKNAMFARTRTGGTFSYPFLF
jgi:hypothetical protein